MHYTNDHLLIGLTRTTNSSPALSSLSLYLEQTYENVLVAFSYTIIYMYDDSSLDSEDDYTAQAIKTSVTNNSLSKDYLHPDDHAKQITDTPGFKPFTCTCILCKERKTEWVTTKTKIFMGFFLFCFFPQSYMYYTCQLVCNNDSWGISVNRVPVCKIVLFQALIYTYIW